MTEKSEGRQKPSEESNNDQRASKSDKAVKGVGGDKVAVCKGAPGRMCDLEVQKEYQGV